MKKKTPNQTKRQMIGFTLSTNEFEQLEKIRSTIRPKVSRSALIAFLVAEYIEKQTQIKNTN